MQITALSNTLLKKKPLQGSELSDREKLPVANGKSYPVQNILKFEGSHAHVSLKYDAGDWWIFLPHWEGLYLLSEVQFAACFKGARQEDIDAYYEPLMSAAIQGGINTKRRLAAFLAQLAHESGNLKYKEEIASGDAYEGRKDLGNTKPGDGRRYKGRGLSQVTGRFNYRKFGEILGIDLENNPELASEPEVSARLAVAYWNDRGLNELADRGDFKEITRRINGCYNGLADRQAKLSHIIDVLSEMPSKPVEAPKTTEIGKYPKTELEVNWSDFNAHVTPSFTVGELLNEDRRRIPRDRTIQKNLFDLVQELEKLRQAWGSPLVVTSGYRPPAINRAVGGVSNSQHVLGKAADLYPSNGKLAEFQNFCLNNWTDAVGRGLPKGFVHLDTRFGGGYRKGSKPKLVWDY